jgi:hypothetical protein
MSDSLRNHLPNQPKGEAMATGSKRLFMFPHISEESMQPYENQTKGATMQLNEDQQAYIKGLRDIADWLEAHPDYVPKSTTGGVQISVPGVFTKEDLIAAGRALGGTLEKSTTDNFFWLDKKFGPHILSAAAYRDEVCEKVVTVTEEEVTEPDPAIVATLPTVTRTVQRETIEWVCPDSVLALVGES